MSRKTFLVLGIGLLLGFGLTLSVGADNTGLERPGLALTTLDGPGNVGQYTSVTIGADGLGLISYYDVTNGNLKVAHCSDLSCVPYRRRAAGHYGVTTFKKWPHKIAACQTEIRMGNRGTGKSGSRDF